jgi:hypothetical protein
LLEIDEWLRPFLGIDGTDMCEQCVRDFVQQRGGETECEARVCVCAGVGYGGVICVGALCEVEEGVYSSAVLVR